MRIRAKKPGLKKVPPLENKKQRKMQNYSQRTGIWKFKNLTIWVSRKKFSVEFTATVTKTLPPSR